MLKLICGYFVTIVSMMTNISVVLFILNIDKLHGYNYRQCAAPMSVILSLYETV